MTKVLIFENDPPFAVELRNRLAGLGCTVQVFDDGNAGLVAAATSRPDLILLSVELPRINGFSICNKIKKDPQLATVPLIILSRDSTHETFEQHSRLPTRAQDYVKKPVTVGDLLGRIVQFVPIDREESDDIFIDEETSLIDDAPNDAAELVTSEMAIGVATTRRRHPTLDTDRISDEPATTERVVPVDLTADEVEFLEEDEEFDTRLTSKSLLDSPPAKGTPRSRPVTAPMMATVPSPTAWAETLAEPPELEHERQVHMEATKHALGRAHHELTHTRNERDRMRSDADGMRRDLTAAENAASTAERSALELREELQVRDRDLLALREQLAIRDRQLLERVGAIEGELRGELSTKEHEVLDARDRLLAAERSLGELRERSQQRDAELVEARATIEALEADKSIADKRAMDFKAGAKKIAEQLNQRARELRDVQKGHEDTVARLEAQHSEAVRALENRLRIEEEHAEEAKRAAIAQREEIHEAQIAELARELRQQAGERHHQLEEQLGARQQMLEQELEQARDLLAAQEEALRELERQHADELDAAREGYAQEIDNLVAQHQAEREANAAQQNDALVHHESVQRGELDAHRDAFEQLRADTKERIESTKAAHQKQLEELEQENAQALQQAGYDFQERLLQKEASFKTIKEQLDRDIDDARGEADRLRETIAELMRQSQRTTAVESERDDLKQLVEQLEGEVNGLEVEREKLNERIAELEAEIETERERAANAEKTRSKTALEQQLDQARAELAQDRANHEHALERWADERKALARARDALSQLMAQLPSVDDGIDVSEESADEEEGDE